MQQNRDLIFSITLIDKTFYREHMIRPWVEVAKEEEKSFTSMGLNWPKKVDALAAVMYSRVEF